MFTCCNSHYLNLGRGQVSTTNWNWKVSQEFKGFNEAINASNIDWKVFYRMLDMPYGRLFVKTKNWTKLNHIEEVLKLCLVLLEMFVAFFKSNKYTAIKTDQINVSCYMEVKRWCLIKSNFNFFEFWRFCRNVFECLWKTRVYKMKTFLKCFPWQVKFVFLFG